MPPSAEKRKVRRLSRPCVACQSFRTGGHRRLTRGFTGPSVQKTDRDCGDNAQRDGDDERDPHANRNTTGKRVMTGWHSHESREPFVEFHGFQSPGERTERVSRG
jgi:hypothetical protein